MAKGNLKEKFRVVNIKKGDIVISISGKDRVARKKGKVIRVFPEINKVLVEGLNFVKKHKRQTRVDRQGGILSMEEPLDISNVMLICPRCGQPTRVGRRKLEGYKWSYRYCKSCEEIIDKI
ncbi:MAG: 50S ribosomal protein L24 [bacterium]